MNLLDLLATADAPIIEELTGAPTSEVGSAAKFDNRPTWDNRGKFDNRPTWNNWTKK